MFDLRAVLAAKTNEQLQAIATNYNLDTTELNRQQIEQLLYEAILIRMQELQEFMA